MKASKFSEAQKAFILKQGADGVPVAEICRKAFIEAFNGRFRSECLNTHWFLTLADAREKMEDWLRYYNEVRPHGGRRSERTALRVPLKISAPGSRNLLAVRLPVLPVLAC